MTTDYKVTEFFCIIDEFCKHFDAENAGNLLEDNSGVKRRRRAASLSDSEIMTILLYFHFGTFRNFKHYEMQSLLCMYAIMDFLKRHTGLGDYYKSCGFHLSS